MMRKVAISLLLSMPYASTYAAQWINLQESKHATLMLDKQSIVETGKYQKAWVKIDYATLQTNLEYPEKSYNNAKLLWYFNCTEQKLATAQVYQLLNEEQIYSAAIDIKRARFLEPVPETEADIAMHFVCQQKQRDEELKQKKARALEKANSQPISPTPADNSPTPTPTPTPTLIPSAVNPPVSAPTIVKPTIESDQLSESDQQKQTEKSAIKGKEKLAIVKDNKNKVAKERASDEVHVTDKPFKKASKVKKKHKMTDWQYTGSNGPEFWGDLSADYVTCQTGRNQSPINIDKTIITKAKPLKTFQRFPITHIVHNGNTILAEFKPGNVMVVDEVMYQMKQVSFHAPSENQIMGKSYPLEAQFLHEDTNGNVAFLAVMYEQGNENKAITKLWQQLPKRKGKPSKLNTTVLAGELMPRPKDYYRFGGSLTTPPCTEGVVWLIMKTTMTVSQQQINAFKAVMGADNNRPVQPLNGRMVIE
ncbi:MAG: carbonic anhydrase family protein [Methylophilaceae bacterium]|nr:MAG: carbonic anhydrase family protein [Methylophilaceae bacterium]